MRVVDWAMLTMQNHFVVDAGLGMMPIPLPPEMHEAIIALYFSDTPMGVTRRARFKEAADTQRVEFQAHDLEIGFSYTAGAFVPDGSTPPPSDPMGSIYYPTTRPGHRLPHAWIERADKRMSTHDLTESGGDFVLIVGPDASAWSDAAAKAEAKFGIGITVAAIGGDYADVDGQWAQVREIADDGAVLVRPDNHVAWRSIGASGQASDVLIEAVGAILGR
jgi:2,4-dichlorophenol 6-monooxygenase